MSPSVNGALALLTALPVRTVPELTSNRRVRGAFTKKAYEEKASDLLKSGMQTGDAWVLSDVPDDGGKGASDLASAYFRAYAAEWSAFVEAAETGVAPPVTLDDGVNALALAEAAIEDGHFDR